MKPVIEFLDKDTVQVKSQNLVIVIERVNGYIRWKNDIGIMQMTIVDASALAQGIEALASSSQ